MLVFGRYLDCKGSEVAILGNDRLYFRFEGSRGNK